MASSFPPTDIDCPDPEHCPVVSVLPRLRTVSLRAGTQWYRVYNATWGYDEHNPGFGDTRFSPIDDPATGDRLPSMYLAATPAAALLETVFHGVFQDVVFQDDVFQDVVHQRSARLVYERDLRGMLLAHLRAPAVATLGDLRDPELQRLGLGREQVVSSTAEHYPCTRRLATDALGQRRGTRSLHGLIWHSRQSELAGQDPIEVMIVFGGSRYTTARGGWKLFGPGTSSLYDGSGRVLVEEIAESLSAVIELER